MLFQAHAHSMQYDSVSESNASAVGVFDTPIDVDVHALQAQARLHLLKRDVHGVLRPVTVELDDSDDSSDSGADDRAGGKQPPAIPGLKPAPKAASAAAPAAAPAKKVSAPKTPQKPQSPKRAVVKEKPGNDVCAAFDRIAKQPDVAEAHRDARRLNSFRQLVINEVETRPRDFTPQALSRAACASFIGHCGTQKLVMYGGRALTGRPEGELYEFSMGSQRWWRVETTGHVPLGRHSHAVSITENGKMLVTGGIGPGGFVCPVPADEAERVRHDFFFGPRRAGERRSAAVPLAATTAQGIIDAASRATVVQSTTNGLQTMANAPCGVLNHTYVYSMLRREWRMLEASLPPVAGHTSIAWNGAVHLFGGVDRTMGLMPPSVMSVHLGKLCDACNTASGEIDCGGCRRALCRGCAGAAEHVAVHQNLMQMRPATYSATQLDTSATPPDAIPAARYGHAAVLYHNFMIISGGRDANNETLADVHALDLTTGRWEALPTNDAMPPRFGHCAVVLGSRLLLVGGYGEEESFRASVTEINLVPLNGHFVCHGLRTSGTHLPHVAFPVVAPAGDNASFVLFGGFGHAGERQRTSSTVQALVATQKWGFVFGFPARKERSKAHENDSESQSAPEEAKEKPIRPHFQKVIDNAAKLSQRAAFVYQQQQKKITLEAQENSDTKLWLKESVIDELTSRCDRAVSSLVSFSAGQVPTSVPEREKRLKAVEDATAAMRQARDVVKSMKGFIKKPFRQAVIMDLLRDVKAKLAALRSMNKGWNPIGEAAEWLEQHKTWISDAGEALQSVFEQVAEIQEDVCKASMERLATAARKIDQRRHESAQKVEQLRHEAIHRDKYGKSKRQVAAENKAREDAKRREDEAKAKGTWKPPKKRSKSASPSRRHKPAPPKPRVVSVHATRRDVAVIQRLHRIARENAKALVDELLPNGRPAAPSTAQPAAPTPAAEVPAAGAAPSAATPAPAAAAPPPPAATAPQPATVEAQEARERAVTACDELLESVKAFDVWYTAKGTAKGDDALVASDKMPELALVESRAKAAHAAVHAVRLSNTTDPTKPSQLRLETAVEKHAVLAKTVRSMEQYVRLAFLSHGEASKDEGGTAAAAAGGNNAVPTKPDTVFTFRPKTNPGPAALRIRASSAHPRTGGPGDADKTSPRPAPAVVPYEERVTYAPLPITSTCYHAVPSDAPVAPRVRVVHASAVVAPAGFVPAGVAPVPAPSVAASTPAPAATPVLPATPAGASTPTAAAIAPLGEPQQVAAAAPAAVVQDAKPDAAPSTTAPAAAAAVPAAAPPANATSDAAKPAEATKPADASPAAGPSKPAEAAAVTEATKAAENAKPAEVAAPAATQPPAAAQPAPAAPAVQPATAPPASTPVPSEQAKENPVAGKPPAGAVPSATESASPVAPAPPAAAAPTPAAVPPQSAAEAQAAKLLADHPAPTAAEVQAAIATLQQHGTTVALPAALSDPIPVSRDPLDDAAMKRLLRAPKRQESLFKGAKHLTPGQRAILARRESNSHW